MRPCILCTCVYAHVLSVVTAIASFKRTQRIRVNVHRSAVANGYWDHMNQWTNKAGQQKGRFRIIWWVVSGGGSCIIIVIVTGPEYMCFSSHCEHVHVDVGAHLDYKGQLRRRNEVEVANVPRFLGQDVRDFVDAVAVTQNLWTQR